jgi:HEAT repeat protein
VKPGKPHTFQGDLTMRNRPSLASIVAIALVSCLATCLSATARAASAGDADIAGYIKDLKAEGALDRETARRHLLENKSPHTVELLMQALKDPEQRTAVIPVLVAMAPESVKPLVDMLKEQVPALTRLAQRFEKATGVQTGLAAVRQDLSEDYLAAAMTLVAIGRPAVGDLVELLNGPRSEARVYAAKILGETVDARAIDPLVAATGSKDPALRWNAVWALRSYHDSRAYTALCAALDDTDPSVRYSAACALRELKGKDTAPALIAHRADADMEVSEEIRHALVALGSACALEPLMADLGDPKIGTRITAAECLGELGDKKAADALAALLDDTDSDVRAAALKALYALKDGRAMGPILDDLKNGDEGVRAEAARRLGWLGDVTAVEPLCAALKDTSEKVRHQAIVSLGKLNDRRAVGPLIEALGSAGNDAWPVAAEALGRFGDSKAAAAIAVKLQSSDFMASQAAGSAMENIATEKQYDALLATMNSSDNNAPRRACARALWRTGPRALEPLIKALGSKSDGVRVGAMFSLMMLKDSRAAGPLAAALDAESKKDDNARLTAEAACALKVVDPKRGDDEMDRLFGRQAISDAAVDYRQTISQANPDTQDILLVALVRQGDERMAEDYYHSGNAVLADFAWDWAAGRGAADQLEKSVEDAGTPKWPSIGEDRVATNLTGLKSSSAVRRARAVRRLGGICEDWAPRWCAPVFDPGEPVVLLPFGNPYYPPQAEQTLWKANRDFLSLAAQGADAAVLSMSGPGAGGDEFDSLSDACARAALRATLGRDRIAVAVRALEAALRDPDANVRAEVAYALGRTRDPIAVRPLNLALKDPDAKVRSKAAIAIGGIADSGTCDNLIAALKSDDPGVRRMAALRFADVRDKKAVEPLIATLADKDAKVRQAAAESLGCIPDARAVDALVGALKDGDEAVRAAAAVALGLIRDTRAGDALVLALKDDKGSVREAAAMALGRIKEERFVRSLLSYARREDARSLAVACRALATIDSSSADDGMSKLAGGADLDYVAANYRTYIAGGDEIDEDVLIVALGCHGTFEMADEFYNSGNQRLRQAGEAWNDASELMDQYMLGADYTERVIVKWGSDKVRIDSSGAELGSTGTVESTVGR